MVLRPEAARLWRDQAQFDYIGPFVKSWAGFNAWFRHACGSTSDGDGLNYVCTESNPVRNSVCPLLAKDNDHAKSFKSNVATLHDRLMEYDFEKTDSKTGKVYSVRFSSVRVLNEGKPQRAQNAGIKYLVCKTSGKWRSEIKAKRGNVTFELEQEEWDQDELTSSTRFLRLGQTQQSFLQSLYLKADPCPLMDLTSGGTTKIEVGQHTFLCSEQDLFSGLVRVLYDMRNCLLHGELVPNEPALRCYEPAFWIIRDLLDFADA